MATHSSTLAWKIPWPEEPGRLQSMGLLRVGHNSATSLSFFTFTHWRRKRQPTPVFLPGESQGQWSLAGYGLQGSKESDSTEMPWHAPPSQLHFSLLSMHYLAYHIKLLIHLFIPFSAPEDYTLY